MKHHYTSFWRSTSAAFVAVAVFVVNQPETLQAQGIERESMAGEAAAEALKGSDVNAPYNISIGPVQVQTAASIIGTYCDNINVASSNRLSDYIVEPLVDFNAKWQVTDLNALNLNLGIGYQDYINNTGASGLVVSPDSTLNFNLFVDDFKINFHDNFLYQQDPVQVGQLSNVTQFSRLQNDGGINVDWDLGDLVASLGYDHLNYWVFQSQFNYLDSTVDSISPRLSFKLSPTLNAGIQGTAGYQSYDHNFQNNNIYGEIGPFVSDQLSENLAVDAQIGYYIADYSTGGKNGDSSNVNSISGDLGVTHRLNESLSESLTAGRQFIPGITSNYTDRVYVQYNASWKPTEYIGLAPNLFFERLSDSNASFHETANRYGAGITASYVATEHLTLAVGYQYIDKSSNVNSLGYYQNSISVSAHYQF